MTTKLTAEFSLGGEVVVSRARVLVPLETGCHLLVVKDDGIRGVISKQMALGNLPLPIPLSRFREELVVDRENDSGRIWTGNGFRRVSFVGD